MLTMNFYHVLPSNTSPQTFPFNHASEFSTPLVKPYDLMGKWEVAITNLTHSNCIYTFNNETIKWSLNQKDLTKLSRPTLFKLTKPTVQDSDGFLKALSQEINELCKNILTVTVRNDDNDVNPIAKYIKWKVERDSFLVRVSPELVRLLNMNSDVITFHDSYQDNYWAVKMAKLKLAEDPYIVVIPISSLVQKIVVKKPKEELKAAELVNRFNALVHYADKPIGTLKLDNTTHLEFQKLENDYVIVLSRHLHKALNHRAAGFFNVRKHRFLKHYLAENFENEWSVSIYPTEFETFDGFIRQDITLERKLFPNSEQVIAYLNQKFQSLHIRFSAYKNEYVRMTFLNENVAIEFDPVIRDILAFDDLRYEGKKQLVANSTGKLSLIRRINYFYIYTNISDMVRIGDTEAPLLAVIPFNPKECKVLTEKIFQYPMYIPVNRDTISQIDVGIYDDAGKLIPFHEDAKTILRLHFRQKL